jgi:hypothetical protein
MILKYWLIGPACKVFVHIDKMADLQETELSRLFGSTNVRH